MTWRCSLQPYCCLLPSHWPLRSKGELRYTYFVPQSNNPLLNTCATIQMVNCSVSTLHYTWRQPQPQDGIAILPASGSIGALRQLGFFPTDYLCVVYVCLVAGGGAYCEVVIVRKVEGEFFLCLICDIQHSSQPVTLPLHGWTEVGKSSRQCISTCTCSVCMYFGPPGTTDQCGLFKFAVWTGSTGHLLLTHPHSHQSHQHLCHSGNETSCERRRGTGTWRGWRETEYCGMYMYHVQYNIQIHVHVYTRRTMLVFTLPPPHSPSPLTPVTLSLWSVVPLSLADWGQ